MRKIVTAFLLLTPWVLMRFGLKGTLTYVTVIVAAFALCRAVAETGWYPWAQEIIPDSIRGKFAATNQIFTTLVGLLAVSVAGYVVERSSDLSGFMILIAAGVLFGLFSVWAYSFIPGGAPVDDTSVDQTERRGLIEAVRDKEFLNYLAGIGLFTIATVPMFSFLPLFMQEQVGLGEGHIVLLQNGVLLGGLLSGYLWGWAADRYGSKPVMLSGVFITIFLPVFWMLLPRETNWSLYIALSIAFFQGVGAAGWTIGSNRILFVGIVPTEKKSDYMALYYAWIGVIGGLSQLIGGRILDYSQSISGQFFIFALDPYTPLFLLGLALSLMGFLVFWGAKADSSVGVGEFAAIFLRGNPFHAMGSMIRYHQARDEHTTVMMTERLSQAKSRLTVDELLEALADPRFHVRFEAIISMAHMRPDPRLTEALVKVLNGNEVALSVIAAWALGRIGDERAREPLHGALDSKYRSVQLHSVRALGALADKEMIPLLQQRLAQESDKGLQAAYASALGHLQAAEATEALLSLLDEIQNEGARMELAFSLARIVGNENSFIQLFRQTRTDMGTAVSQSISSLQRKWRKVNVEHDELTAVFIQCAESWGYGDLDKGTGLMNRLIRLLPGESLIPPSDVILQACGAQLDKLGATRPEYVLLTLHVMHVGWQPGKSNAR
jgi:MFS family permease